MKKVLCVLLHILGYPLLLAAMLYLNWNIIMTQTKNYGVFVFVGVIVAAVMAIIYYVCYAAITSKKKKKRKTIFNQTVRLCMVVVITMTGLWVVCDVALPDMLAGATSSTIYYEDLADGWDDRADVNEALLDKFIELSVKAGTLPHDASMTEAEAVEYYQNKGYNEAVSELSDNEHYGTIGGLFAIQYQSINAKGYQTFTHPWIDCATSDRLTIPCLVHLLLDEREISQKSISNYDYTEYVENPDGTKEVTSVFFAVYDKETSTIKLENVNWTVLDMLGTDNVVDLSGLIGGNETIAGMIPLLRGIIDQLLPKIANIAAADELLGSPVEIKFNYDKDMGTAEVVLTPMNESRGVLGYQEMAWLDSNGLIYALVTLFSTRRVFLVFAAWGVVINLLIGLTRGMCKEEKEKRRRVNAVQAPEKRRTPVYGAMK